MDDPCYVFKAIHDHSSPTVVASVSDGAIKAYAVSTTGTLTHTCELAGHSGAIRDVGFYGADSVLHSVSSDGTVRGWDARSGKEVERLTARGQELFSMSLLEHMVVAGGAGQVLFWDRRAAGKQLAVLEDTHMDDVTQVKLHASGRVLSASADGLIAVHDTKAGLGEDDSFQAALNITNSVEEMGLFGGEGEKLWIRTGTESLHMWHWRDATTEDAVGGDGPAAEWIDARGAATAAASGSPAAAAALGQVDYLIGCHYDSASDRLSLVAGSNNGAAAFIPLQYRPPGDSTIDVPDGSTDPSAGGTADMASPSLLLQGGHTSVVRSAQCFSSGAGGEPFCLTGGEDALICVWSLGAAGSSNGRGPVTSHRVVPAGRSKKEHQPASRKAPY